jgi:hypothetical protein
MDKIEGYIEVGTNENHEVIINLDKDRNGIGHIVFSVRQAKDLANTILKQARIAEKAKECLPPLKINDIERCPCCTAPRDEWDYCDLCRPSKQESSI